LVSWSHFLVAIAAVWVAANRVEYTICTAVAPDDVFPDQY
jgi:hypothetical protein